MKYKLHRDLRFVSSLYEHPGTFRKRDTTILRRFFLRSRKAGFGLARVLAKSPSGQAVISCLSLVSAKKRGDGESPLTIRAGPTISFTVNPDQRAQHIGNHSNVTAMKAGMI